MIMLRNTKTFGFLCLLGFMLTLGACRKDQFDQPPSEGIDPNIPVNMTLDSLKKIYRDTVLTDKAIVKIEGDWTIAGLVIADDKSGNLYKTVNIDDGTAGMSLRLDVSNYNTSFPVGTKVYLKLKGLVMGQYGGLMQLGGFKDTTEVPYSVAAIPASLVRNYLTAATYHNEVVPYTVDVAELGNTFKWQNRLVRIENVQFKYTDTSKVYADNIALTSVNRTVEDCYGGTFLVRTSGYSNFAGTLTPTGSGTITGVFSVFSSDKQLIIRDLNDVVMDGPRLVPGSCGSVRTDIETIRAAYAGGASSCPNGKFITGVVISDLSTSSITAKNVVVQDGTAGIIVRFSSNNTFLLGDSIKVEVSGQTLSEYNGLLEIGGTSPSVPNVNAVKVGTGTITPRVVTLADIVANMAGNDSYESTLVQVSGVTISGSGTYSGSTTLTDATGTLPMFTTSVATFATQAYPTGVVTITGYVGDFNGAQLNIRNTTDVQP